MSRPLGPDVVAQIIAERAIVVHFIEATFSGGVVRLTTAPTSMTWNGQTWTALGGDVNVGAIPETGDLKAQGVNVKLSGVDQTIIAALLGQNYRGRTFKVWRSWIAPGTNLVENSDLEADAVGWNQYGGATLARDTTVARGGSQYSLKVTTADVAVSGVYPMRRAGTRMLVTPGLVYTYSLPVWVLPAGAGKQLRLTLEYWNAASGGAIIGSITGSLTTLVPGWQRLTLTGTPVAGTVAVVPTFYTATSQGVFDFWIDRATFVPGPDAGLDIPTNTGPVQGGTILADPVPFFIGYMNEAWEIEETGAGDLEGRCTLSTRMLARSAAMEQAHGIRANLASHQRYYSGDTFWQNTPGMARRPVKWPA